MPIGYQPMNNSCKDLSCYDCCEWFGSSFCHGCLDHDGIQTEWVGWWIQLFNQLEGEVRSMDIEYPVHSMLDVEQMRDDLALDDSELVESKRAVVDSSQNAWRTRVKKSIRYEKKVIEDIFNDIESQAKVCDPMVFVASKYALLARIIDHLPISASSCPYCIMCDDACGTCEFAEIFTDENGEDIRCSATGHPWEEMYSTLRKLGREMNKMAEDIEAYIINTKESEPVDW
jgi:hypothetical protein